MAKIPDATLRLYPDTGYLVHWERPEWVVQDLEAFTKTCPQPSSSPADKRGHQE